MDFCAGLCYYTCQPWSVGHPFPCGGQIATYTTWILQSFYHGGVHVLIETVLKEMWSTTMKAAKSVQAYLRNTPEFLQHMLLVSTIIAILTIDGFGAPR